MSTKNPKDLDMEGTQKIIFIAFRLAIQHVAVHALLHSGSPKGTHVTAIAGTGELGANRLDPAHILAVHEQMDGLHTSLLLMVPGQFPLEQCSVHPPFQGVIAESHAVPVYCPLNVQRPCWQSASNVPTYGENKRWLTSQEEKVPIHAPRLLFLESL